jgi:hypothetical protein
MKKRYINELLWHISLFGCIFVFNRNHLPWCQLELVDIICQKVVCTQTKISVFIIRPVSNMSPYSLIFVDLCRAVTNLPLTE